MRRIDFIAAGQDRGTRAVLFTLLATMLGASATLGVAESAEKIGFPAVWWLLCGCMGLALQAAFLSARIRDTGAQTLPELARLAVGPAAQRVVAAVIVLSWPAVVGAQFAACAGLVGAFAGTDARAVPILVSAACVVLYTLVGGQRAVVRTDAWELLALAVGFGGLFLWVFTGRCGGAPVPAEQIRLFSEAFPPRAFWLMLPTVAGAYFLGPDIASRSIVARDGRTARRAVLASVPVLAAFAIAIALAGLWAAANAPGPGNPVLRIAWRLPAPLRWCLAAGLLAALLSTADTCLVNAAAILSNDLLGLKSVRAARWAVAAVGLAATALALFGGDIIGILLLAYSVYVPGVVCPLAVAVIARGRVAPRPWLAAVACGGVCGLASALLAEAAFLPPLGMALSLLLALVSLRRSPKVFTLGRDSREKAVEAAAQALLSGGVVVFPTDTVYGIAAHPRFPEAVARIYAIKGRAGDKPIAFLASDCDAPARFGAAMPPKARAYAERFWPGALTLVLACGGTSEGFRVPDCELARAIIARCGGLLRVTSANLSGSPAQDEITEALKPVCGACDVVVDDGKCKGGVPSTVAKFSVDGAMEVLRQGAVVLD